MYEINDKMQVRHVMSQRIRTPQTNGRIAYLSFAKDGKNHSRSIQAIFKKTWPEVSGHLPGRGRPRKQQVLVTKPAVDLDRYYRIPTFPEYGINHRGQVLQLQGRRIVEPGKRGELSVHLKRDGAWHYISIRSLLRATFGDD